MVTALVALAGCATTTVDDTSGDGGTDQLSEAELTGGEGRELAEDDTSPLDTGVIVDPASPPTTIPMPTTAGTTAKSRAVSDCQNATKASALSTAVTWVPRWP